MSLCSSVHLRNSLFHYFPLALRAIPTEITAQNHVKPHMSLPNDHCLIEEKNSQPNNLGTLRVYIGMLPFCFKSRPIDQQQTGNGIFYLVGGVFLVSDWNCLFHLIPFNKICHSFFLFSSLYNPIDHFVQFCTSLCFNIGRVTFKRFCIQVLFFFITYLYNLNWFSSALSILNDPNLNNLLIKMLPNKKKYILRHVVN